MNEEIEKREIENKKIENINKEAIQKLVENHKAILGWDTMFRYTSELQDFIKSSNRPVALIGRITDIVKKDSLYILEIAVNQRGSPLDAAISEIRIDSLRLQELKKHITDDFSKETAFVIQVKKIGKSRPTDEDESDWEYIHFEGEMIDYYIFKDSAE